MHLCLWRTPGMQARLWELPLVIRKGREPAVAQHPQRVLSRQQLQQGMMPGSHGARRGSNQHVCMGARTGNVADVLYGASLIPGLQSFDISYQALTGTLPDVSLPAVQTLSLSNNYLEVGPRQCCDGMLWGALCTTANAEGNAEASRAWECPMRPLMGRL